MYKKTILLLGLLLVSIMGVSNASTEPFELSNNTGPSCDCSDAATPEITYEIQEDTCQVNFTATVDPCYIINEIPLNYSWSVNGGAFSDTGTNATYNYEDVNDVGSVQVRVVDTTGYAFCEMLSEVKDMSLVTCNVGALIVSKQAYNINTNTEIGTIYVGWGNFEWRVTVENPTSNPVVFNYVDFWPDGSTDYYPDPVNPTNTYVHPPCPFVINSVTATPAGIVDPSTWDLDLGGVGAAEGYNISGKALIPANTTLEIVFNTNACNDGNFNGTIFTNCFKVLQGGEDVDVCDNIRLIRGCPVGMTDGYCLEEEDMDAGSTLTSHFVGHTRFLNITKAWGTLIYDTDYFNGITWELDPVVTNDGFVLATNDNGDGSIDFEINPTDLGNEFDIAPYNEGGTFNPFSVNGVLLSDLGDCLSFTVLNFKFETSTVPGVTQIYADPGIFCGDFTTDPNYESAVIEPEGTITCVGSEAVVKNVTGPFDSQNEDTVYAWSTGLTGHYPSISISSGGTYSVNITDNEGCARFASITIEDCEVECECGALDVTIDAEVEGCYATFTPNIPNCNNLEFLSVEWDFANGNVSGDLNPPAQNFAGPVTRPGPKAILTVKYGIDGAICVEEFTSDPTIFCLGPGFKMYPNPGRNNVNIELIGDNLDKGQLVFYDMVGTEVLRDAFVKAKSQNSIQCDISSLSEGLYFVQLIDNKGNVKDVKRLAIK